MKTARHVECETLKKEGQWKVVPSEILVKISILIITGVQASGVIIDRLLRQCCFVWSEIVGPHSSGNFND